MELSKTALLKIEMDLMQLLDSLSVSLVPNNARSHVDCDAVESLVFVLREDLPANVIASQIQTAVTRFRQVDPYGDAEASWCILKKNELVVFLGFRLSDSTEG